MIRKKFLSGRGRTNRKTKGNGGERGRTCQSEARPRVYCMCPRRVQSHEGHGEIGHWRRRRRTREERYDSLGGDRLRTSAISHRAIRAHFTTRGEGVEPLMVVEARPTSGGRRGGIAKVLEKAACNMSGSATERWLQEEEGWSSGKASGKKRVRSRRSVRCQNVKHGGSS